jgi:hypothetical protein
MIDALHQLAELRTNVKAAHADACDAIERFNLGRKAFLCLSEDELKKALRRGIVPRRLLDAVRVDEIPPPIPDPEIREPPPPPQAAHAAAG